MNESYVFNLNFNTDLGKTYTLRLTGADPDATDLEVKSAMLTVIDSNVILHVNGALTSPQSAELVTTAAQDIDVSY